MPASSAGSPWPRRWSAGEEPVPALVRVRARRLRRVEDEEALLLGERVHARAGGEVVRVLGAAVQHDDQRQGATLEAGRLEQLEAARAGCGGEGALAEAAGPGDRRRRVDQEVVDGRRRVAAPASSAGDSASAMTSISRTRPSSTIVVESTLAKWALPLAPNAAACVHACARRQRALDGLGGLDELAAAGQSGRRRGFSAGTGSRGSRDVGVQCNRRVTRFLLQCSESHFRPGSRQVPRFAPAARRCAAPRSPGRPRGRRCASPPAPPRRGRARRGWWRRARSSR